MCKGSKGQNVIEVPSRFRSSQEHISSELVSWRMTWYISKVNYHTTYHTFKVLGSHTFIKLFVDPGFLRWNFSTNPPGWVSDKVEVGDYSVDRMTDHVYKISSLTIVQTQVKVIKMSFQKNPFLLLFNNFNFTLHINAKKGAMWRLSKKKYIFFLIFLVFILFS